MTIQGVPVPDIALIPAAGEGVRAYPKTGWMPKPLLPVAGRTLIERNIELLRDALSIRDIVVITGHLGQQIREHCGDGSRFGVRLRYVDCPDPGIGLARGMLLAEPLLDRTFVTVLGDELYLETNHHELRAPGAGNLAVCAITRHLDKRAIQKNYSVELDGHRITAIVEKPEEVHGSWLGCGTYVLTPEIFERIRGAPSSPRSGRVELMDVIGREAREGRVEAFELSGQYMNVNSIEDYNEGNYLARSLGFESRRVSVVIPTRNEEETIEAVARDFASAPQVDEVLVVDNASGDRTVERARAGGARVEQVSLVGYGDTIAWGLDHAQGEILIVTEADHSFRARDLGKLLEYAKDADLVMGTRTTREMVEQGTNMVGIVRWANVLVGQLVEVAWWSQQPRFTDVGCTYRAIWRDTWQTIRRNVHATGPEFAPEVMIEVLRARRRVVEIPVSYFPRAGGESKHSKNFRHLSRTALRMLLLIFSRRLRRS